MDRKNENFGAGFHTSVALDGVWEGARGPPSAGLVVLGRRFLLDSNIVSLEPRSTLSRFKFG